MTYSVSYSPEAGQQLTELYQWIAEQSGYADRARNFVSAVMDYCDGLAEFPLRGAARDDIRPGLRTIGFRRRAVVAFAVQENRVEILGVFYGGQDVESLLSSETD